MKKRVVKQILTVILAVIIVVSSVPIRTAAATTNEDSYIEIRTIEELYNVRDDLTTNYILMNDIDLTEATAEGGEWDFMGNGWNPIGSNDIYGNATFSGTFDGNGHTIRGMRIDVTNIPTGADKILYVGLFSEVSGEILNLNMEDVSMYVDSSNKSVYVGTIAAKTTEGIIDNCKVTGKIESVNGDESYVGGVAGYNQATISKSSVDVELQSKARETQAMTYAGGVAGYNSGTIQLCYANGSIIGYGNRGNTSSDKSYGYAGGLVGYNKNGIIENCYNTSDVDSAAFKSDKAYSGGISGYHSGGTIVGCYNIGIVKVAAKSSEAAKAVTNASVSNCFYLQGSGVGCTGATALTETQMLLRSMYKGLDFDAVWMINADAEYPYPQLVDNLQDARVFKEIKISSLPNKTIYEKWEELDLTGCVLEIQYFNAETEYVDVTKEMVTGFDSNFAGEKVLTITYGNRAVDFVITVSEKMFKEIHTAMDLYNIRYDLDGNYILMNDIDLTEVTAEGGEWDFEGRGWNPIGSDNIYSNNAYRGIFNGNGHSIKGMRIDITELPEGTGNTIYAGLFANVTGEVKGLTLDNVYINVNTYEQVQVGAITATTSVGKLSSIDVSGNINVVAGSGSGSSTSKYDNIYVGGISAYNTSIIMHSKANINITAKAKDTYTDVFAGGISGYNKGDIKGCFVEGDIQGHSMSNDDSYAGGVSGDNIGCIENCYNLANVTSANSAKAYCYAGGIAGYSDANKIFACYNRGIVKSAKASNANAISDKTVSNCYYLQGTGLSCTGATSLTETQMELQSVYVGFDFENVWYIDAKANYPYPQLIENEKDIRVIKEAKIHSLPDKVQYTRGEELDVTGLQLVFEYKNAETEYVTVTNDMVSGFSADTVGKQTLSTTYYDLVFNFEVTVNEKPFLEIYTVEDLYNVRKDLSANYILMNDIDLTEATAKGGAWDFDGRGWNPIGSNDVYGNNAYSGIFDGNGYTIAGLRMDVTDLPSGIGTAIYCGLFAHVSGEVKNLNLQEFNINIKISTTADFYVGALCGRTSNGAINCCNADVMINTINTAASSYETNYNNYVGGLVGYCSSTITNSYTCGSLNVKTTNSSTAYSAAYAGGISGYGSNIQSCYNTADLTASAYYSRSYAGGITARKIKAETIQNCYNTGLVTSSGDAYAISAGTVTNCYYLEGTGKGTTGTTALTEAQMKLEAMYDGFDFENVWVLNSHANYPYAQLCDNVQDLDETVKLIRVIAYPIQTEYLTDDIIDPTGGMFEAVYISGKTELLEITADMLSGYEPKTIGKQSITVTYGGQTDTFTINVSRRPEVTAVELVSEPTQKDFVIGTAFDFSGAQVKVSYDNNTSEIINVTEDMTTGGDINHIDTYTITVNCGQQTVTFEVNVIPASISSIEIRELPTKLTYMEGEVFDATGMVVMATYSNGSTVQIKSGYKVTGYLSEPGIHKVTIEFAGQKATFDVTVNERVLLNLEIKAKPDKLNYVVGEELDLTGLLVVASYENGDLDIIEDYTVSGLDGKAGSKVITLTYKGKTASFVVNVAVKCVEKIEIIKMPTKLSYIESEALNVEGMIVKATYNDGEIKTITDYKLEGYSSLPGVHTVYVSYEGQVDSFDVNVTEKVLSDLKVTIPTKTTYEIGETFDATGMVVTAYYNNGQQYSVDNYVMSEFDSNSAGAKEIKITYEGMTRSFVVTVVEKTPIETGGKIEVGTGKVRLGETISVPVTITKNTGLSAFCHTITFDANDLAFKKVNLQGGFANGTVIINDEKVANGEITILWFQANNVMESGIAYTLEFEVLETATDGISDITIAFDANENGNASGENVLFEAVNGGVEVLSYWLGDLNGDRKYAMADLLQLAQYVSGQTMTLSDKQKLSADVNEDGIIDIHDVTLLSQWLLAADM